MRRKRFMLVLGLVFVLALTFSMSMRLQEANAKPCKCGCTYTCIYDGLVKNGTIPNNCAPGGTCTVDTDCAFCTPL